MTGEFRLRERPPETAYAAPGYQRVSPGNIDLNDRGKVGMAQAQLDRAIEASDDVALAAWARKWGRSALQRCGVYRPS